MQSAALMRSLDRAIRERPSIRVIASHATQIIPGKPPQIMLDNDDVLGCGSVLVCNGAAAQTLIDGLAEIKTRVPRVLYGVGFSAVLRPGVSALRHVVRSPNRGFACGIHAVPDPQTADLYVGATNITSTYPRYSPRVSGVHNLLEAAMMEIHSGLYDSEIVETRVGLAASDGRPLPANWSNLV